MRFTFDCCTLAGLNFQANSLKNYANLGTFNRLHKLLEVYFVNPGIGQILFIKRPDVQLYFLRLTPKKELLANHERTALSQ